MTYARKVDTNHAEIRDGLRAAGYKAIDASKWGDGFPDLIVIDPKGRMYFILVEVKEPDNMKFTKAEVKFYLNFVMPDIRIVTSLEQMLRILGER